MTKPLQYVNVLNIPVMGFKHLLIVNSFVNAKDFYKNIKQLEFWENVTFFSDNETAYTFLIKKVTKKDFVFIDSDYGLKKMYFLSRIKTLNIFVYEEGEGSYRNNLLKRTKKNVFLYCILKLLGVKEYFGGSKFVKGIYIYNHEKFKFNIPFFNNQLYHFNDDFISHLNSIKDHFYFQNVEIDSILKQIPIDFPINIYLTTYSYNIEIEKYIKLYKNEFWVIKPHPQIVIESNSLFQLNMPSNILIELLILRLINDNYDFRIFHEGSSALLYFPNVNNILIGKIP